MSIVQSRRLLNILSLMGLLLSGATAIYFYHLGIFQDPTVLKELVSSSRFLGPLAFVLIQVIQVVIPVIPGGISTAAGVMIFGPVAGFFYNYIGICLGSLILFSLGRQFGKPLILRLINEKTYDRYAHWLENQGRFEKFFALAIFFPIAPDDALCLMASLTKISLKRFSLIILLGKPLSILLYSMALVYGGQWLTGLLG